jgi:hypothetical protein
LGAALDVDDPEGAVEFELDPRPLRELSLV